MAEKQSTERLSSPIALSLLPSRTPGQPGDLPWAKPPRPRWATFTPRSAKPSLQNGRHLVTPRAPTEWSTERDPYHGRTAANQSTASIRSFRAERAPEASPAVALQSPLIATRGMLSAAAFVPRNRRIRCDRPQPSPRALSTPYRELHDIVENDRYPPHPHSASDPRQAQAGAGSRAPATAEGLCAAIERPIPAPARLK